MLFRSPKPQTPNPKPQTPNPFDRTEIRQENTINMEGKEQPRKLIHRVPFTKFAPTAVVKDVIEARAILSQSTVVRYILFKNSWFKFEPHIVKIKAHLAHLEPGLPRVFPSLLGGMIALGCWLLLYRTYKIYTRTRDPLEYHDRRPYSSRIVRYWSMLS